MLGAGKDCTALFNRYHAWVNYESMLSKCQVGVLSEGSEMIEEGDEGDGDDDEEQEKKSTNLTETARNILEGKLGSDDK